MTLSPSQQNRLQDLIDAACENDPAPAVLERLESLLLSDDDACRYYLDYISLHGALILASEKKPTTDVSELEIQRSEICKSQIPNQQIQNLPSPIPCLPSPVILDTTDSLPALASAPSPFYIAHPFMFSNLFAVLVICLGALGAWLYQVDIPQPMAFTDRPVTPFNKTINSAANDRLEFVGRVTDMCDVQWADVQTSTVLGANVPLGRKYALASGLMEISYHTGAKVILQGPCTYKADSRDGGFLTIGKLTAKLEKREEGRGKSEEKPSAASDQPSEKVARGQWPVASKEGSGFRIQNTGVANHKSEIINHKSQSSAPVFTIHTPTATVTDLGTEFGVEVEASGACRTHVFQGKVAIHTNASRNKREIVLTENQSVRVEANGTTVSSPNYKTNSLMPMFARRMPGRIASNAISLANLVAVAGGAFDSRLGGGLDPRNANMVPAWFDTEVKSSGKFERYLGENPRIDGVFMPLGGDKPVQLDSIGHTFMFPKTCGHSFGTIWASKVSPQGKLPVANGSIRSIAKAKQVLLLHANAGITFDLSAIQSTAGRSIVRFQSLVANRPPALHVPTLAADVWVFVDGQLRFSQAKLRSKDAPVPIDFALSDGDRFLTLVSTDGGDESYFDDIQYIDPQILLKATAEEDNDD